MKNEVFCLNGEGQATAHMKWVLLDEIKYDRAGQYTLSTAKFMHQGGKAAKSAYAFLNSMKPGDTIETIHYGSAMVIDKKDNGLTQIQTQNGQTRWITSDEVR